MAHLKFHNYVSDNAKSTLDFCKELIGDVCVLLEQPEKTEEVIAKLLDSSVADKIKPKKDPNKPKRPNSNYIIFSKEVHTSIREENPNVSMGEISKLISAKWKSLSDSQRQKYTDKATKEKEEYEVKIQEYNDNIHLASVMQYVDKDEDVSKKSRTKKNKNKEKSNDKKKKDEVLIENADDSTDDE